MPILKPNNIDSLNEELQTFTNHQEISQYNFKLEETTSRNESPPLLYSYIRFSTPEQANGKSLDRQLEYARKVANERGLKLDENLTFKDLGKSGYHQDNIKNGELGHFLNAVEENLVPKGSILVIESLDRLSRADVFVSQGILAQIINAGITVITAIDGKEYSRKALKENGTDLFFALLVFMRANDESETKSQRATKTIISKCQDWLSGKRGFKVGCDKPPKWLKWCKESNQFIFVPREKKIIQRKIELFQEGLGAQKMAKILNNEFGPNTVHFTGANIYKEVRKRTLIGEFNVTVKAGNDSTKSFTLDDYYPSILSISQFNQLQDDAKDRAAAKSNQKFVGILSGSNVFKCGCCGKSVGSHVNYHNKDIKEVSESNKTYICNEAKRQNCENKHSIYISAAESAVINYCKDGVNLRRVLSNKSAKTPIIEELNQLLHEQSKLQSDINIYCERLLDLNTHPKAVIDKINELEEKLKSVEAKINSINTKLAKINSTSTDEVANKWKELTDNINSLSNDDRQKVRLLIKDTFHSIILHPTNNLASSGISGEIDELRNRLLNNEVSSKQYADLTLRFHNGLVRIMRVNKYTGELIKGFDLT